MARRPRKTHRPPVRPPSQARSRDTLRRIVETTASLLEERGFERLTVEEIARRSGSSVGAFYARFADKDALLGHLEAAGEEAFAAGMARLAAGPRSGGPLAGAVADLVRFLTRYYRTHAGVLRALTLRARAGRSGAVSPIARHLPKITAWLLARRSEINHSSPEHAAYIAGLMVLGVLDERILSPGTHPSRPTIPDTLLGDELALAVEAYLTAAPYGR